MLKQIMTAFGYYDAKNEKFGDLIRVTKRSASTMTIGVINKFKVEAEVTIPKIEAIRFAEYILEEFKE